MGKKQIRNKINKEKTNDEIIKVYDKKQATKIFIIIILLFLFFYIITTFLVKKEEEVINDIPFVEIQYEKIIAGELFNQSEDQYYVTFCEFDSEDAKYLDLIIDNYFNENTLKVYKINLNEGFNNSIIAEESNSSSDIAKLKVKGTTLIRIKNSEIELFVEGLDKIEEYFED